MNFRKFNDLEKIEKSITYESFLYNKITNI